MVKLIIKNTMKRIYQIICILVIIQNINAQSPTYVYTPRGSVVSDTYIRNEEITAADIVYINGQLDIQYPNAQKMQESTTTYNCHAYAWSVSEGGQPVWMGLSSNPTSIYWTDGSYIEVTNPEDANKVSYANDNHSAITTSETDFFISKWGAWPLMKHQKNDCPYNSSILKYYKIASLPPTISGPSTLYSQATYTIDNLPPGAAVEWSVTQPYIAPTIYVQNSGTVILTNHYGIDGIGTHGTLQAVVTFGNQQIILTKDILFGWAVASIGKSRLDMRPGEYILEANTTNDPNTSITSTWSVTGPSAVLVDFPYPEDAGYADKAGRLKVLEVYTPGYYTVCATANDGNYTTQPYCAEFYIDDYKPAGGMFSLSPNPATTSVTITMDETKLLNVNTQKTVTNPKAGYWQIQLWNSFGLIKTLQTDQKKYQLDLSGLSPGFYYVLVIRDGKTYRRQLMVQ